MKHDRLRKRLIIILGAFFLCGCAVSESYKLGQEMAAAKRWEDAVSLYEKAVSESPDNQEFREALQKAKQESAKIIAEKAKASLASQPEPNIAQLERIAKEADRAAQLDPANKDIAAFSRGVKEKIGAQQDRLKDLYAQADGDMQKEDWLAAAVKLRQINKIMLNYEETARRLARVEQEGAKMLYQQGLTLAKQEDWKMAAQSFKAAMDVNPQYYDVAKLYQQAKERDSADYFLAEGAKAERSQNWDRAITMLEKALEYQTDNAELGTKLDALKLKAGKLYFAEAVKLANQGMLHKAMSRLEAARTYTPALASEPTAKDFNNKFCTLLMDRAAKYAEKELWGNAYVWLQKAESFNPNYPNLFQKLLEARDKINTRIRKSIAVFDFGAPSNHKDAGKIAANKLIAYLHKNASGDLRIIERENLQSILREMQLGQTGLVDIRTAQSMGKMRGIDTFIMGDVLQYSANYIDRPSNAQERVVVDEEDVPNPAFELWKMMHPKPNPEDLATAPAMTVKKPRYQLLSYRKGSATITSMIEVSYKLVDTSTGENIFTNNIAGKLIKDDKYSEGLSIANVAADPLELPTQEEVLDELTNAKVSEVGQSVLKQYQSLEVQYFNDGQLQEKRRNFELALEKYTDALFDEKLKGMTTPVSQKCQELITKIIQDR